MPMVATGKDPEDPQSGDKEQFSYRPYIAVCSAEASLQGAPPSSFFFVQGCVLGLVQGAHIVERLGRGQQVGTRPTTVASLHFNQFIPDNEESSDDDPMHSMVTGQLFKKHLPKTNVLLRISSQMMLA